MATFNFRKMASRQRQQLVMNGYCECGCGGLTPLAPSSETKRGWIKGQPIRFIRGHNTRTPERRAWSAEHARQLGRANKGSSRPSGSRPGPLNPQWKGDDITYSTVHRKRIPKERGSASDRSCVVCGKSARQWALNHSASNLRFAKYGNVLRPFSVDPHDYDPLCVPCHRGADIKGGYRRG